MTERRTGTITDEETFLSALLADVGSSSRTLPHRIAATPTTTFRGSR